MKTFEYVLVPLCVLSPSDKQAVFKGPITRANNRGQHWMLLVADVNSQSVYVCNSVNVPVYQDAAFRYIDMFR
jgi:hypothetical protein